MTSHIFILLPWFLTSSSPFTDLSPPHYPHLTSHLLMPLTWTSCPLTPSPDLSPPPEYWARRRRRRRRRRSRATDHNTTGDHSLGTTGPASTPTGDRAGRRRWFSLINDLTSWMLCIIKHHLWLQALGLRKITCSSNLWIPLIYNMATWSFKSVMLIYIFSYCNGWQREKSAA